MPATRRVRALAGVGDQIVYSATNFVLTLLVARYSSAREFGLFSVLVATFLVFSAINRGIASEPLIIRYSAAERSAWRPACEASTGSAFAFGLVVGLGTSVATLFVLHGDSRWIGLSFAAAMPLLFVQDQLRYAALSRGRPAMAIANDLTVAVFQLTLSALAIAAGMTDAAVFVVIWTFAGVVGGAVGVVLLGIRPTLSTLRSGYHDLKLGTRLGLDNFVTQIGSQGSTYVVAAVAGLEPTAGLRVAQTIFTPPAVLVLGLQVAVTPELVRLRKRSLSAMRRALSGVTVLLMTVFVAYVAVVLLVPRHYGAQVFGHTSWERAVPLLLFVGLGGIGASLSNAAVAGLRTFADARRTLRARSAALVIAACVIVPGTLLGGVRGAAIALAITTPLQAVVWWASLAQSMRAERAAVTRRRLQQSWQDLLNTAPDEEYQDPRDEIRMRAKFNVDLIDG